MKRKVMIANYDPNVLRQQEKAFEGLNVEIRTVQNGDAALVKIAEFQPDMLLLDPMLPKVSGFDVAQKVRGQMPDLPIIMITAVYRGLVYRTQAIDKYGATEYLEEPVSAETLRAVVEKYIGVPVKKSAEKKSKVSSKKRLEALLQDTKGGSKAAKKKKSRGKVKLKVEKVAKNVKIDNTPGKDSNRKSTRKKLEAILKESHVH